MRLYALTALLAAVSLAGACIHGNALHARMPSLSLDEMSSPVPRLIKRQKDPTKVPIYFSCIQMIGPEIYGCYAGGSTDEDKVPRGPSIKMQIVDLKGAKYDPNLDLGVMVYYIRASDSAAYMYDTSTAPVLAEACNQLLRSGTNLTVSMIILSHEHDDHVNGLGAPSLAGLPLVAQAPLVAKLGNGRSENIALQAGGAVQTLPAYGGDEVKLMNVQAHTPQGTIGIVRDVALMGDEVESLINYLVTTKIQTQSTRLQRTEGMLGPMGVCRTLPAHGSGVALFGSQFGIDLLESNIKYLNIMATNPRSICGGGNSDKAKMAQAISVTAGNITNAYFASHEEENCVTVGAHKGRRQRRHQL